MGFLQRVPAIELGGVEPPGVLRHVEAEQGEDVGGRLGQAGQHVHRLRREVTALLCPLKIWIFFFHNGTVFLSHFCQIFFSFISHLTQPNAPAAVLYGLPGVGLVQDDEVTL